jgi:hypothetical protein
MSFMDDMLRFRATVNQNREIFLLNYKAEFETFNLSDQVFPRFTTALGAVPPLNPNGRLSIAPFLQIMRRQARNAFEHLSAYQSYPAWVMLRPFVEAALILGKWCDDPQNATIWISRNSGKNARKQYQDAYSGDRLRSQSLLNSDAIRQVWSRVGDEFLNTNPHYYTRVIAFSEMDSKPSAFRMEVMDDFADHRAHVYAFLHLIWFVLHAVGRLLEGRYGAKPEFRVDLGKMEHEFATSVIAMARQNETHRTVLTQLGLWPHHLFQPSKGS